ncbi:MAG: BACON domain-containing protein [Bacteroidales bacterium]|nr:BACON domain-containing protein [Bacteroidales bacterium]
MKNCLLFAFFFLVCACAVAQGIGYKENYRQGVEAYNNQRYQIALEAFYRAQRNTDRPPKDDLDFRIRQCKKALESKPVIVPKPEEVDEPEEPDFTEKTDSTEEVGLTEEVDSTEEVDLTEEYSSPVPSEMSDQPDQFELTGQAELTAKSVQSDRLDYSAQPAKQESSVQADISTQPVQTELSDRVAVTPTVTPSQAAPTPKAAVKSSGMTSKIQRIDASMRFGCVKSRQGVEVTIDMVAENLKGQTIFAECIVRPEGSRTIANGYRGTEFDVHGLPGMRGHIVAVDADLQVFTETFFVPFGAMALKDYEQQPFDVSVKVFTTADETAPLAGGTFSSSVTTTPVSLYVDNDIKDCHFTFDGEGGYEDLKIMSCSNIEWLDLPSWIEATTGYGTVNVQRNESPEPREAVITIRPIDGGNSVRIRITQKGGAPLAQALVNSVHLEQNRIGPDGRRKTLIHADVNIYGQKDNPVQVSALFYQADGTSQLIDEEGQWIAFHQTVTPTHENSKFEDLRFLVDNPRLFKSRNTANEVKIVIAISFDGGNTWISQSAPRSLSW